MFGFTRRRTQSVEKLGAMGAIGTPSTRSWSSSSSDEDDDGNDLSREQVGDIIAKLSLIISNLQDSLYAYPYGKAIMRLARLGLLSGIGLSETNAFLRRLRESPRQKMNIAEYLMNEQPLLGLDVEYKKAEAWEELGELEQRLGSVFFESGSTIAYLIGRLAAEMVRLRRDPECKHQSPLPLTAVGNNACIMTAFPNLVQAVEPTFGTLDLQYFGLFPFPSTVHKDFDVMLAKRYWRNFRRLHDRIVQCNTIYATSSEFSFLAGPIVGSYQNALTKRVIHAGFRRDVQTFNLLLHFEKLVGITGQAVGVDRVTMRVPRKTCFPVFKTDDRIRSVSHLLKKDSGNEVLKWHESWVSGAWNRAPIEALWSAARRDRLDLDTPEIRAIDDSWLDCARGIRLIIGMPTKPAGAAQTALAWLRREIDEVNVLLRQARVSMRYSDPSFSEQHQVAQVDIK